MSLYIGSKEVGQIFVGNKEVQSVYCGNISIYENFKFEWSYETTANGNVAKLIGYTEGSRTDVKIPGHVGHGGLSYTVTEIQNNVFKNTNITSITIPNTVTTIGSNVFYGCQNLRSVNMTP